MSKRRLRSRPTETDRDRLRPAEPGDTTENPSRVAKHPRNVHQIALARITQKINAVRSAGECVSTGRLPNPGTRCGAVGGCHAV
ncbi:unnamed protein product, partial [Iphiclides podalirius]